jgi:flagellar secretion chaperone FliS
VSGFAYNPRMAAYRSTLVHGGVANADPHALVQMLLDAALDRMTQARGCIERGELAGKAKLLHSCVIIIAELRGSLDLAKGGALARNLRDLYEYMSRRLMLANVRSDVGPINEVLSLLGEIRSAWVAIASQVRSA